MILEPFDFKYVYQNNGVQAVARLVEAMRYKTERYRVGIFH
jgi:hypothetical protein